jgi:hypothetical protein
VQTAVFGAVGAVGLVVLSSVVSDLPLRSGLAVGIAGLAAVLVGLWVSVGDLRRITEPAAFGGQERAASFDPGDAQ